MSVEKKMQTTLRTVRCPWSRLLSLFLRIGVSIPVGISAVLDTAIAQSFPTRPVRLIIPYTAGGPTDGIARPVSEKLGEFLGQPVVMDYKPGANGVIGTEFVAKSSPDGYTLLLAPMSIVAINPAVYKSLPYDVVRDFSPVALVCSYATAVFARGTLPANDIPGLIALAKANPGGVSYGSAGHGSQGHLGGVMLDMMARTKMTHVPYKGILQVTTDMLGDRLDIVMAGITPTSVSHLNSGKLKLLASAGSRRFPEFPNVATVAETLPGFWNGTFQSLLTRAGLPAAILTRLNSETNRALRTPEVKGPLQAQGYDVPADSTTESLAQLIAAETIRWAKVTREAKIELN